MFVNMHMKNFNLNDFQNICRACMSENALETLQDGHMKVLNLISKVKYSKTDELPQKLCDKCVRKVNDIVSFGLLCKRIDQTLKKYLENLKIENMQLDPEPLETVKCEEITIVEEKIEFIDVNEQVDLETNYVKLELERIKEELIRAELDEAARAQAIAEATPTEPPSACETPVELQPAATAHAPIPLPNPKPRPYKCTHCARTYSMLGMKRAHERKIHSKYTKKFKCYQCELSFPTELELKNHKKIHRKIIPCEKCNEYFSSRYKLAKHQKIHKDENKQYECLICFKRFHMLKNYLKHNSEHGNFTCEICNDSFRRAASLARHKLTHKLD